MHVFCIFMQKGLILSSSVKLTFKRLFFYIFLTHISQLISFTVKFSRQCVLMGVRACMLTTANNLKVEVIMRQGISDPLVLFWAWHFNFSSEMFSRKYIFG